MEEQRTDNTTRNILIGAAVVIVLIGVVCFIGVIAMMGARSSRVYQYSGVVDDAVDGSGVLASESRTVARFSRVVTDGATRVVVKIGSPQSSVVVETDDNLIKSVVTTVQDDELTISTSTSFSSRLGVVVRVTVPRLDGVDASGTAQVEVAGLEADEFAVLAFDGALVKVNGAVSELAVDAGGTANVDASELTAKDARVDAAEAASVRVQCAGELDAHASGTAKVLYDGAPRVKRRATESGSVEAVR